MLRDKQGRQVMGLEEGLRALELCDMNRTEYLKSLRLLETSDPEGE